MFKSINSLNYQHDCLYLALLAGGLNYNKLQQLVFIMRNRTVHACDLFKSALN